MIRAEAMIAGLLLGPQDVMLEGLEDLQLEPAMDAQGCLMLCELDADGGVRVRWGEGGALWVRVGKGAQEQAVGGAWEAAALIAKRLDPSPARTVCRGQGVRLAIFGHVVEVYLHERRGRIEGVMVKAPQWMPVEARGRVEKGASGPKEGAAGAGQGAGRDGVGLGQRREGQGQKLGGGGGGPAKDQRRDTGTPLHVKGKRLPV